MLSWACSSWKCWSLIKPMCLETFPLFTRWHVWRISDWKGATSPVPFIRWLRACAGWGSCASAGLVSLGNSHVSHLWGGSRNCMQPQQASQVTSTFWWGWQTSEWLTSPGQTFREESAANGSAKCRSCVAWTYRRPGFDHSSNFFNSFFSTFLTNYWCCHMLPMLPFLFCLIRVRFMGMKAKSLSHPWVSETHSVMHKETRVTLLPLDPEIRIMETQHEKKLLPALETLQVLGRFFQTGLFFLRVRVQEEQHATCLSSK